MAKKVSRSTKGGTFVELMHKEMLARGIESQKQLARDLGKKESTVSLWLTGVQCPRPSDQDTVRRIADFLKKTPDEVEKILLRQKKQTRAVPSRAPRESTLETASRFLTALRDSLREMPGRGLERLKQPMPDESPSLVLRRELGRDWDTRRVIETICCRLDEVWAEANNDRLSMETLESVVAEVAGDEQPYLTNLVNILRAGMLEIGLFQTASDGTLERPWPVNSSYVLNSLFGIPLFIRNLDWLLDGGLLLPPGSGGLAVLIKGKPGTGKTMLALQIAGSVAAAGHVVVYLTAEQSVDLLLGQLDYAGYKRDERAQNILKHRDWGVQFAIADDIAGPRTEEIIFSALRQDRGILLVASTRSGSTFEMMQHRLSALAGQETGRPVYRCGIIDSLDAVAQTRQRPVYQEIFSFLRDKCDLGILISESHEQSEEQMREHLVDMSFRMGYRNLEGFKARVLEIEKCRAQSAIRGEHRIAIHRGRGITVYPSVQSLLSVWRRRSRRDFKLVEEPWRLDGLDVSSVLRDDSVQGSAMLLSGPPATHKLVLGLSFLAAGLEADRESHHLIISLREEQASITRIVQANPQLRSLLADKDINPRLKVRYIPPDYFTADRFLDWVRQELAGSKKQGAAVSRVIFSSINQLFYNSPMCGKEPLLFPTLIQLFKKQRITSLFISVGTERTADFHNIFDTVIFTSAYAGDDPNHVLLQIGHSATGSADRAAHHLTRDNSGRLLLQAGPVGMKVART